VSFNKQDIYKALETITAPGEGKSLIENNNVTNIVTFGDEVEIDVTIGNPTLQAKKKIEVEISENIKVEIVKTTGIQGLLNTPEVKK
jgi:ATP-binding protein involved in chromosome partitioning